MGPFPKVLPEEWLTCELIAPCGMDCALCRAHLREKDPCPGCNGDDEAKPGYCVRCRIKTCERIAGGEAAYCIGCATFPCARLRQLDKRYRGKYGMSMLENLRDIEENGVEAFVETEKVKWACPECGSVLSVHLPECGICGRVWNAPEAERRARG